MPEIRQDYLTKEWVCISALRDERPNSFKKAHLLDENICPFCPENKHMVLPDILKQNQVRVVPNRYPILDCNSPKGYGFHEVVIDTPSHTKQLHQLSCAEICDVFLAIKERVKTFYRDKEIKYVQVFRNHGAPAGASISHSHWQLVALPFLPEKKRIMAQNFESFYRQHGQCYICETLKGLKDLEILRHGRAVAYAPYAALYKDGVNISLSEHVSDFTEMEDSILEELSFALKAGLTGLSAVYPELNYNLIFHSYPQKSWHFYFQIVPRVGSSAGYELATGCTINSVDPLDTAMAVRQGISLKKHMLRNEED